MRVAALPDRARLTAPLSILDSLCMGIAAGAAVRDRVSVPAFPQEPFELLANEGLLAWNAVPSLSRPPAQIELTLVRRITAADASVGRIFDGHLNAIERLMVQAPAAVRDRELPAVLAGKLRAGVWGGNPAPREGPPANVVRTGAHSVLRGCKTFCSGAGGLDRALVLARDADQGGSVAVWIDLHDDQIEIDRGWYQGSGMRASESHRVLFHDVPVLGQFGGAGALAEQPWFGRDALRTAASWVGIADAAVAAVREELAGRDETGALTGLAAGRIATAHRTAVLWLKEAAQAMNGGQALAATAVQARVAIADAIRVLFDEAARVTGSAPFARGGALDRARRDFELFVLQHRLDPPLARDGAALLQDQR